MCLNATTPLKPGDGTATGKGWKFFDPGKKGLFRPWTYGRSGGRWGCILPYKEGVWYKASGAPVRDGAIRYPGGFHVFKTQKGALAWTRSGRFGLRCVEWKRCVARGTQSCAGGGAETLIVRHMRIIPKKEKHR